MLLGVDGEARRLVERAEAGLYFTPSDPRALLDGIATLAADPALRERMGRAGHHVATTEFDRGVLARRYAEILRRVVAQPSRGARRPRVFSRHRAAEQRNA
jgi:glycosyltransferase involved in cell wall biosynthesis